MLLVIGFAIFGLLMGLIAGVSSAPITQPLIAALFAFIGGKIFIDFDKKSESVKKAIGMILIAFSTTCLIGIVGGIYMKTNYVLGKKVVSSQNDSQPQYEPYLKSSNIFYENIILKYRQSGSDNCDSLLDIIEKELENEK